jgi:hypothetical protein
MTLRLQTAATGVARAAHYVIPTGATQPIQTLLLEPQRTNLCIRSEEFETWSNVDTCNVTANAIAAPDGTTTADLLTATLASSLRFRTATFTGDGEKCAAVYLKAGTSTRTTLLFRDSTAAVNRHNINVTWTAGVPTVATAVAGGSGTIYPVEALRDGWYRILWSATGIVGANSNFVGVQPDTIAGTGSVYAWGAQAEDAVVPSSYIKTEGTTVTRNADSLYFPFTAPPQAMTVYVRGGERGFRYSSQTPRWVQFSSAANAAPRFLLYSTSGGTAAVLHGNDINADVNTSVSAPRILGDVVEARGVLRANGSCLAGASINGAAEVVSAVSSTPAAGLAGAWSDTRMYLSGPANTDQPHAYTHVLVATGEQSMATMRQLAGVV